MTTLPIRRISLYQSGIAYLVRQGFTDATSITIPTTLRDREELLKSLSVIDRAGGFVRSIAYDTQPEVLAQKYGTLFQFEKGSGLADLLWNLRGQQISVGYVEGEKPKSLVGQIVSTNEDNGQLTSFQLLGADGQLRYVDTANLRYLRPMAETTQKLLTGSLEEARPRDNRQIVTLTLSEGQHDIAIFYTVESPSWRVTYRAIAETNADAVTGELQLQGFAVFENTFDEDLSDVQLEFIAGRPNRIEPMPLPAPAPKRGKIMRAGSADGEADEMRFMAMSAPVGAVTAPPQPTARDLGDVFQYSAAEPVTLARGVSALVPILTRSVSYQRQLLYNTSWRSAHPQFTIRFDNTTALVLEKGVVVMLEDELYRGESHLEHTPDGAQVTLSYGDEQGIKIRREMEETTVQASIGTHAGSLVAQSYRLYDHVVTLDNTTERDQTLALQLDRHQYYGDELVELLPNLTIKPDYWEFLVQLPAKQVTTWHARTRSVVSQEVSFDDLTPDHLTEYLAAGVIDRKMFKSLEEIADVYRVMQRIHLRIEQVRELRLDLERQNEDLRKSIAVLQTGGDDNRLRQQILAKLEKNFQESESLLAEKATLEHKISQAERKVQQLIAALPKSEA